VSETAYYIASLKIERNLYAKLASLHPSPAFAADVVSYLSSAVKGELDQEAVILAPRYTDKLTPIQVLGKIYVLATKEQQKYGAPAKALWTGLAAPACAAA
jgi:hypothetical protein